MNRWKIPIGAVLVHICIGSVYAWSVFNRPIQTLFPDAPWWFSPPYTTFTTALALLGLSAAFGGPWVERRGPRVAATAAALFFGTGLVVGGGAFVAGYLNVFFMDLMGVATTVMALGATYLIVMLAGSRLMQLPPPGW